MLSFPLEYVRSSFIYENDLWIGRIENQMLQNTQCMIFIVKVSLKTQTNIVSLARGVTRYPTETKFLALLDYDSVVDKKQLLNISVNSMIFQMESGGNMNMMTRNGTSKHIILTEKFSSMTSICPGTETKLTTIQKGLCPPSYWNPSGKHLTITLGGIWPYITRSSGGRIGGTEPMILKLLAKKFNFSVSFHPINNHKEYYASVSSFLQIELSTRLISTMFYS